MALYKFGPNDVFHNRVKTNPQSEFLVYNGDIYYNNKTAVSGAFTSSIGSKQGHINLYEMNVDRLSGSTVTGAPQIIYPFITKSGALSAFKTTTTASFSNNFSYGDIISSSYPMTSSLYRTHYIQNASRKHITALKNILGIYAITSAHYAFSSSLDDTKGGWDKGTQPLGMIEIPSIFYGSSIRRGSVKLQYYVTGTLIAEATDKNRNGELIQVSGSTYAMSQGSASIAGTVLYNEGIVLLTGSWKLEDGTRDFLGDPSNLKHASWQFFGASMPGDGVAASATLSNAVSKISFEGVNYVPTLTLMAHARKSELNHSNNPTYLQYRTGTRDIPASGTYGFAEQSELSIKNVVSSAYDFPTASFEKVTYISKIGIYDEQQNLIGVAGVATPVKKTENNSYTFKLKIDF
jgi:hypothetical protein